MNILVDSTEQFRDELIAHFGVAPSHIEPGQFHRFGRKRVLWCKLFIDCNAGVYGDWRTSERHKWFANQDKFSGDEFVAEVKRNTRLERLRHLEDKHDKQANAAAECQRIYSSAAQAPANHDYLVEKQVERFAGVFRIDQKERLIATLENIDGQHLSNQYIARSGKKLFHPGGKVKGCFCVVQRPDNHTHFIFCEGVATGCTIAIIDPAAIVVAAMNCGNLEQVACEVRRKYPHELIIIAGDNDRHTPDNPGKTAAVAAASAVGGKFAIPEFPIGINGTDFNDLICAGGWS